MDGTRITFRLEVVPGTESIRGVLCDVGAEAREFNGWLELVALIEEVRIAYPGASRAADPSATPRTGF